MSYLKDDNHDNIQDVERMILGNKCDMEDKRVISYERGQSIAKEHGLRLVLADFLLLFRINSTRAIQDSRICFVYMALIEDILK